MGRGREEWRRVESRREKWKDTGQEQRIERGRKIEMRVEVLIEKNKVVGRGRQAWRKGERRREKWEECMVETKDREWRKKIELRC